MNPLTQAIISGLTTSAVYALLSCGLIIVFRTSRILNLAHGETYAVAGITASLLAAKGLPAAVVLPAGIAAAVGYSVALERLLIGPRRTWPIPTLILITLAASFLTRGVLFLVAGVDAISFPRLVSGPPIRVFGGAITVQALILIVVGFTAALAVTAFLALTRPGRQLRATAENPEMAELMGISTDRVRLVAFVIAGLLGGLGAVLLVPLVSVDFQAGLAMTMRGFIVAALVGMSPTLAVAGSLGLGFAEAFVTTYFDALLQDPIVFLALIAIAVWQSRNVRFGGSGRA